MEKTNQQSTFELTREIVANYHMPLKTELPKLSELTATIMRVHGGGHPELYLVHRLFHELKIELDQHLVMEEVLLFPLLRENAPQNEWAQQLAHVQAGLARIKELLPKLSEATNTYQAPEDGCGTYHATYRKLAELEKNLLEHVALEEGALFTRFA